MIRNALAKTRQFFIGESSYLGYDAIKDRGRRRPSKQRVYDEDIRLNSVYRERMQATAHDAQRNFAVAAWMVRRHLDYVATFNFQARTTDKAFNFELEQWAKWWGRRYNCDVRRKHSFRKMIRLMESRRVVDGDIFMKKLMKGRDRGRLQAIEADRVADPEYIGIADKATVTRRLRNEEWKNGVRLNVNGEALEYIVTRRVNNGQKQFERFVQAKELVALGYYDRFDQVRGVSPLSSALNTLADLYEGLDYAFMKVKLSQLFGFATYRDVKNPFDHTQATQDRDQDGVNESAQKIDFGNGPVQLNLDRDDRVEILESQTPSTETTQFLTMMVHIVLKALDLPMSFFDESHSNWYSSRAGLIQYQKSAADKICDLQESLDEITRWRLGVALVDGEITLPSGMTFDDLKWDWKPVGVPWWDPTKEVAGHKAAISANLDTFQRVCNMTGTDYYENVDANAKAIEYAEMMGVAPVLATSTTHNETADVTDGNDTETDSDEANTDET